MLDFANIQPHKRYRRTIAIILASAVSATGVAVTGAQSAQAMNPCRADKPPMRCWPLGPLPLHSGSKITSPAKQTLASRTDLVVGWRFATERTH